MPFLLKCGEGALAFYRLRAWEESRPSPLGRPWPPLPPVTEIGTEGRREGSKAKQNNRKVKDLPLYLENNF